MGAAMISKEIKDLIITIMLGHKPSAITSDIWRSILDDFFTGQTAVDYQANLLDTILNMPLDKIDPVYKASVIPIFVSIKNFWMFYISTFAEYVRTQTSLVMNDNFNLDALNAYFEAINNQINQKFQ